MLVVCIDGTDVESDPVKYNRNMEGSFVKRVAKVAPYAPDVSAAHYIQGPTLYEIDRSTSVCIAEAKKFIRNRVREGHTPAVYLVGYSRGASACVAIAMQMRRYPAHFGHACVQGLGLFDAVQRSWTMVDDTGVVPNNVPVVHHAIRGALSGEIDRTWTFDRSRWYMGNTSLEVEPGVIHEEVWFRATHAALGGCPWTGDHPVVQTGTRRVPGERFVSVPTYRPLITEEEDRAGSALVWTWMSARLIADGVLPNL